MKVFSSVVALLFTSVAAASEMHEVFGNPKVIETITSFHQEALHQDEDIPCIEEGKALFECLGTEFAECLLGVFVDLAEIAEPTCDDISSTSTFCTDLTACIAAIPADKDCTAQGETLAKCAEENEEEGEGEGEQCEDVCDPAPESSKSVFRIN